MQRPAPVRLSVADVVALWVLSNPTPQETKTLQNAVERAGKAVELGLGEGVEAAMNRYNK